MSEYLESIEDLEIERIKKKNQAWGVIAGWKSKIGAVQGGAELLLFFFFISTFRALLRTFSFGKSFISFFQLLHPEVSMDQQLQDIFRRVWTKLQALPEATPVEVGAFAVLLLFIGEF